jgi:hypothetical protein
VIIILHLEATDGRVGLPRGVVLGQSTLPLPVILWVKGAQGWDCLLSVHCLSGSLFFSLSLPSTLFVFKGISQNILQSKYDLCSKLCMPARVSYLLYTELCLKPLKKKCLLLNPNSMNRNREYFLSGECVYCDWMVSIHQKFLSHNNVSLVKTRSFKTVCMGSFYLEFLA